MEKGAAAEGELKISVGELPGQIGGADNLPMGPGLTLRMVRFELTRQFTELILLPSPLSILYLKFFNTVVAGAVRFI